jgi:hypothetical protein
VDVYLGIGPGPLQFDIGFERLSRLERKCGSDPLSQTAVTLGADINLPIARKFGRINDVVRGGRGGRRTMAGDMLLAWTMASLAGDSENKISLIVAIFQRRGRERLKVSRMAFHAAGNYGAVEIGRTVQISGTIDPPAEFDPIRNGQFEKLVVLPI